MTFIIVGVEVSCLLRFTLAANSVAHTSQFGLTYIFTKNIQTDRQTEKAITEATLIPWIAGLRGPIFRTHGSS